MVNPYTPDFFARERESSREGARVILPLVFERYRPRTVIDIGCGCGAWCVAATQLGAENATGIDGPWVANALAALLPGRGTHWHFIARDLRQPLPQACQPWGLAICLETAEHLPPTRGPGLVSELCALSPVILWSAATPGQQGEGHINEQPPRYWSKLFRARGYSPDLWIREAIAGIESVSVWYRNNIVIYARCPTEPGPAGVVAEAGESLGGSSGNARPGATSEQGGKP